MTNKIGVIAEFPGGLVRLYEDGSIQRRHSIPIPCSHGAFVDGVASTDVTIHDTTGVWARVFLPHSALNDCSSARLPIVVYFHGGGFCVGSPSDREIHSYCCRMSVVTRSIWVSLAYRLAPENRLPVGCEDCIEAIAWLNRIARREIESPWLSRHGDLECCFLAGESAGAHMVHQVALFYGRGRQGPVKIIGMILLHPGFVKEERSKSETENPLDLALVPAGVVDKASKLALPQGISNRNYYIFNPWIPNISQVVLPPALVTMGKLDIFYDRSVEYCRAMQAGGQDLEAVEYANMGHCFHLIPKYETSPEALDQRERVVNFMRKRLQILRGPRVSSKM